MEWERKQLKRVSGDLKVGLLLIFYQFSEYTPRIRELLKTFVKERVKFIIGVITRSFNKSNANIIIKETRGNMVKILNISTSPR